MIEEIILSLKEIKDYIFVSGKGHYLYDGAIQEVLDKYNNQPDYKKIVEELIVYCEAYGFDDSEEYCNIVKGIDENADN